MDTTTRSGLPKCVVEQKIWEAKASLAKAKEEMEDAMRSFSAALPGEEFPNFMRWHYQDKITGAQEYLSQVSKML